MAKTRKHSDAQVIEQSRIALDNVEKQPQIATTMADFGYDTEELQKGKQIWQNANNAFNLNKTEDDETSEAYVTFTNKKNELESAYKLHRKKARVIFRNDTLTLEKLGIKGGEPKAHVKWMEIVKKFYATATTDTAIQSKLARLKITPEELTATNTLLSELEVARSEYMCEKGESQDATLAKDQAIAKLDEWMREFYSVAKIAMEDNIQLLESLGKTIKN
jgi:hypothetical protein